MIESGWELKLNKSWFRLRIDADGSKFSFTCGQVRVGFG